VSAVETQPVRRVSVVVPMRNEAHRVDGLVEDLVAQDFDGEIEVIVADGESSDGSAERLAVAAERAGLPIELLENPGRTVAPALNMCIERATGDLIVRLDCKSRYPPDYLRRCAAASEETGAENVGGLMIPVGETPVERAAACAMDTPFGGIGWTRLEVVSERVQTDTVYLGAFRPDVFERVGAFLDLGQNHDDEFNARLRAAGGRVVLDPSIRAYYTGRRSLTAAFNQYFFYGLWKPQVMALHRQVLSARSLVPPAFVASLLALAPVARRSPRARRLLTAELSLYAACVLAFSAETVTRRGEPRRLLPVVAAVFPTFHVAYGSGVLAGLARMAFSGTFRSRSARARTCSS
jgi:succinoglycan biosynthesis protein ExoA